MDFDKIYSEATSIIKSLLYKQNLLNQVDPGDLISDSFIALTESNKEITLATLIDKCKGGIINYKSKSHNYEREFSRDSIKACVSCNEGKPAACFRIEYHKKLDIRYTQNICRDCIAKKMRHYFLQNKEAINLRRRNNYLLKKGVVKKKIKLTPSDVTTIKQMLISGHPTSEIKRMFNISYQTVYLIRDGKIKMWKDIAPSATCFK